MTKILANNVELALKDLFKASIAAAFPAVNPIPEILITPGRKAEYQCNNAMGLAKKLSTLSPPVKMSPMDIGAELTKAMPENDLIETAEPSKEGFINVTISKQWVAGAVQRVVTEGIKAPVVPKEKVLVDFSSPNIAKEMHVGHLRSTIIGETICRLLEFCGQDVSRINHVGDWGTQFGMLILLMKQEYPDFIENPPNISDLQVFYKAAKVKFDADPEFKEQARLEVVKLQALEETSIAAWKLFCQISEKEFNEIYDRLKVKADVRGESFYNPLIPGVLEDLRKAGVTQMSDGAEIIVSTDDVANTKIDAKAMAKLMTNHFLEKKHSGELIWSPVLLAALEAKGLLTMKGEGDAAVQHIQVGKKDTKKMSDFDVSKDVDKLAKVMEPLYKGAVEPTLLEELVKQGAANTEAGMIKVPRFTFPLMARKRDGGYTYDTTDLAAVHHRFQVENNDRVIYVTDVGQFEHFKMILQTAEDMKWMDAEKKQRWAHAGFGLVSGADGKKLKTRSGETTKLKDLLDEACDRSLEGLKEREAGDRKQGHSEEYMQHLSKVIGYGAVKYFDLKQNRTTDYKFDYDKMLDFDGNTAVFLLYSYARMSSIIRKSGVAEEDLAKVDLVTLEHPSEKNLALAALKFENTIIKTVEDLYPHHLTDFAYEMVGKLGVFYQNCPVVGSEQQASRLALVQLVRSTLKQTLDILGIEVADRL